MLASIPCPVIWGAKTPEILVDLLDKKAKEDRRGGLLTTADKADLIREINELGDRLIAVVESRMIGIENGMFELNQSLNERMQSLNERMDKLLYAMIAGRILIVVCLKTIALTGRA